MKKILIILLSIVIVSLCLVGCNSKEKETTREDETLINEIVSYFLEIAKIPRQSEHEEKISEYLLNWAKERGFSPRRDEENNIIFDVPASSGMENAPLTILQAHMDMVIAVIDGKEFDPQKDGITVINDGKTLTADGTSLGADNGIGIAMIMHIIEHNNNHGPLRIIITTKEEIGIGGVSELTSEDVKDVKNVINVDSERSNEVTNSAAAGLAGYYYYFPEITTPTKDKTIKISISGLLGGHSGLDIDKGHLNAIKTMGSLLKQLIDKGINYELISIEGGNAGNAIPSKASSCIVISSSDENKVNEIINEYTKELKDKYGKVEKELKISIEDTDKSNHVFTETSRNEAIKFVSEIIDGVYTMSEVVDGLVESSSNLGLISFDANKEESTAETCVRSSTYEKLFEIIFHQSDLADECNVYVDGALTADPWPVKTDNQLLDKIKVAYLKVTGEEMKVVQLHAGLEASTFAALDPDLDIVSIGPDVIDPHTTNETLILHTLPITYRVIENTLLEIGKETK